MFTLNYISNLLVLSSVLPHSYIVLIVFTLTQPLTHYKDNRTMFHRSWLSFCISVRSCNRSCSQLVLYTKKAPFIKSALNILLCHAGCFQVIVTFFNFCFVNNIRKIINTCRLLLPVCVIINNKFMFTVCHCGCR